MIRLRPHHLLCTQGYSGRGYSTEFVQNMSAIVHSLRNVPGTRIRLVFGSDSLCAHCPHHTADDLCEAQEKVSRFDRKTVEYFDLHEGEYRHTNDPGHAGGYLSRMCVVPRQRLQKEYLRKMR